MMSGQAATGAAAAALLLAAAIGGLIAWKPAMGLGAVVGLSYLAIAASNAQLAFLIWIPSFFLPFYSFGNLWLKAGFAFVGAAALASAVARRDALKELLHTHRALLLAVAVFLGWLGVSAVWAPEPSQAIKEWLKTLLAISVLPITLLLVRDTRVARMALAVFVGAGALSAAAGLSGLSTAPANADAIVSIEATGRISAGIGDPNVLAAFLVATIALALGLIPGSRGSAKVGYVVAVLLGAVGLAATQSRGGFVAATVAIVTAAILYRRELGRILPIIAVTVCGAAVYFVSSPAAFERVTNFGGGGEGRSDLWTVGWRTFVHHPVIGVGLNQFRVVSKDYVLEPGNLEFVHLIAEHPLVVHNIYLQLLAENGVIGLALFLLVVWLTLRRLLTAARHEAARHRRDPEVDLMRGLFVAIVAILTAGFFLSTGNDYNNWLLFGVAAALGAVVRKRQSEPET